MHDKGDPVDELYARGPHRRLPSDASVAAFVLGGIGTGHVSVGARGELRDWELFNWPGKRQRLPSTFFAIWSRRSGAKPIAKVLEAKLHPPHALWGGYYRGDFAGLPRMQRSWMTGEYPFVSVDFEDDELPVAVSLEAFTPFIPLNADDSGIPGAYLRYRIHNPLEEPVEVSVVGSLANVSGFDGYDPYEDVNVAGRLRNEFRDAVTMRGLDLRCEDLPADHPTFGSMALTTTATDVSTKPAWVDGEWTDPEEDFWADFASDGRLEPADELQSRGSEIAQHYSFNYLKRRERPGSLAIHATLAPRETRDFEFTLAWHFPNRVSAWIDNQADIDRYRRGEFPTVRNYYATLFEDAWAAADYLVRNRERLEAGSRAFRDALYSSTLPWYVVEALAANITVLRSPTCFRIADGRFMGWEGVADRYGCGPGTVNHVWNYAQTVAFLFPELEQSVREYEFALETDNNGRMPFRFFRPLGQEPWVLPPAADGQLGSIIRLYREWRVAGCTDLVSRLWPKVVLALEYALREWDTDGDDVLDGPQHNTYDIEFYGPNSMTGSLLCAAARAASEMAAAIGDHAAAARYESLAARTSATLDALLWNGEYFEQRLEDVDAYRYQYGTGCLSDQLLGQFLAHVSGLGHVLPADHVASAARAVFDHNFVRAADVAHVERTYIVNDERGVITCTWPRGGRPRFPVQYADEVWTGIEYEVASNLIFEGYLEEGLTVAKAVRDRHDGYARSPWNEVESGHHYVRSMASWGLLVALSGYRCDVAKGEMSFDPVLSQDDFRTFWSNGKGWGTYHQWKDPGTGERRWEIEALYGSLGGITVNGSSVSAARS